jgi:acetylornithine deacetylase/succinyl-diaminopimelate desuccinylase-like protein
MTPAAAKSHAAPLGTPLGTPLDTPLGTLEAVLAEADRQLPVSIDRLFDLLRIPSVSAQPDHAADCVRAADWCRDTLRGLGFSAETRPTDGHPVVLAHLPAPPGHTGPHMLFYGHYDVQPAEPLELWDSPPFEPRQVDGPRGKRFVARGAVDNKGQVMMFLEALRAWRQATGAIPAHLTVLLEGEEEVGSVNLDPFLRANRDALGADLALISDTGMWDIDTPAITTRLRGLAYVEVTLKAANRDLHSGLFGGSALNPINALTRILGDLQDTDGHIQIPGFYDGVTELSNALAAQWEGLGFDEAAFLGGVGLSKPAGERGRPALQRLWSRPTADINGIWGGYAGAGAKTVIAAEAGAKISFRLVPGQDPAAVVEGFRRFVADRAAPGAQVDVRLLAAGPAIAMAEDSPYIRAGLAALAEEYGRPALVTGCGGSIPVVASLKRELGIDSLLMGFGLDDDQVHSPNEKFEQTCFHRGIRSHVRLLGKLAGIA